MSEIDFIFQYPNGVERVIATVQTVCQRFFGVEHYPEIHDKAAAILYHLILDHHMVDGNKRFAMLTTEVFLEKNGYVWEISDEEYVSMALRIADVETRPILEELRGWMANKIHSFTN